jgi:hypothetical protein
MIHLLIGGLALGVFFLLLNAVRIRKLRIRWWQWILTIFEFLYTIFVLEIIVGFLQEGTTRGALVVGLISGMVAVIGGVLLARFVFFKPVR